MNGSNAQDHLDGEGSTAVVSSGPRASSPATTPAAAGPDQPHGTSNLSGFRARCTRGSRPPHHCACYMRRSDLWTSRHFRGYAHGAQRSTRTASSSFQGGGVHVRHVIAGGGKACSAALVLPPLLQVRVTAASRPMNECMSR